MLLVRYTIRVGQTVSRNLFTQEWGVRGSGVCVCDKLKHTLAVIEIDQLGASLLKDDNLYRFLAKRTRKGLIMIALSSTQIPKNTNQ